MDGHHRRMKSFDEIDFQNPWTPAEELHATSSGRCVRCNGWILLSKDLNEAKCQSCSRTALRHERRNRQGGYDWLDAGSAECRKHQIR